MLSTSPMGAGPGKGRVLPIDHLRAVLVLLVVAHHAVLAYVSYAPAPDTAWDAPPMMWRAFPVVDTVRAPVLDLLVAFNDAVLMALLFFLAGLFTWRALIRKGALGFLLRRARRLGLPFVVCAAFLAPLAYYPAYWQHGGEPGLGSYAHAWLSLPVWPSGPAWFLWVLLAFSAFAALSYRLFPGWGDKWGAWLGPRGERPWTFFGLWLAASALVYLPLALSVDPLTWFELGPFTVQTSRVLLYALYFLFGIGVGAHGTNIGLLSPTGRLARGWLVWQGIAAASLVVMLASVITLFLQLEKGTLHPALPMVTSLAFTLSCTASSLMLLSMFARLGHWSGRLWRSLGRNAYGVYLVHYVFVSWLQLAMLDIDVPAVAKAALVFVMAAGLSWMTAIFLRRIPGVASVI